jgi:outer membrane protein TolC
VLEVQGQVREALASWRIGLASARAAAKIVETCREAVSTATALYEAGMVPALDVLTAQADLTRAEADHIQALGEVLVARAKVERLAGKI